MPTSTQYAKYSGIGGGSGGGEGVTSLNGETGAINIVAGTGIAVTPVGQNITISATGSELVFADSIVNNSGTVTLVNDSATPGATKYYGTNSGGTLGYYSIPATGVTSVSVVSANGLAGTVANPTTTPAITLSTTITGTLLAGNGTAISAAALANGDIYVGSASNLPVAVPLSGDATLANTGALTLATVNSNVGSFTSANITVNAKGLITAASNGSGGGSGTVTSVALTTPGVLYNVTGSPVTTAGTLTLNLNNQTANTVFAGPISGGAAAPTFRSLTNADLPSGVAAFAQYASSQITTASSSLVSGTFSTFSNSPAFTFTPTITGRYKVYASTNIETLGTGSSGIIRIFNTSGGATLLQESQGVTLNSVSGTEENVGVISVYTLTAGVSYQFDIQGKTNGTVVLDGSSGPFYMFAEGIALAGTTPIQFFQASSQITTLSTGITASSYGTFSNSPALTVIPANSGIYKIYIAAPLNMNGINQTGNSQIILTSGTGATLLQNSQGVINSSTSADIGSTFTQAVYNLTAGNTYVFDIQGAVSSGTLYLDGRGSNMGGPSYMFCEGISLMGSGSSGITEAQVWARISYGM